MSRVYPIRNCVQTVGKDISNGAYRDITGAILAGGKNERMEGADKSFIKIGNTSIIQKTIDILKSLFREIIIVTNSPSDYKVYKKDCHIVTDIIKDIGPLGGIHSALSHASKDAVFFIACDMPFLHNGVIRNELDYFNKVHCDALIPRIGRRIEPLHSVYGRNLKHTVSDFIKSGNDYSVRGFLETVDVRYWDLDDTLFYRNIFKNLNTPEEVERVKKINEDKIKGMA
ncbi:MAG: molybdenum cofactor guanylyltransferase [Candidatus Omnitrophica bacterium]|nr:molybdenum cofactor guanylyltransferase [Candidatus Omnitrophota bacterium]